MSGALKARLRDAVQKMRRTPVPIDGIAPLLQQAADRIDELELLAAPLPAAPAPTEQATDFLMPEDAWNEYATRSGLLNEHGVAPDPAKTQTAYFAYIAAWNRLHAAFSAYIVEKRHLISSAAARQAPDSRDAALEAAARIAMDGPLLTSAGEHLYMNDNCKAMALMIASRIRALKGPAQ